MIRPFLQTALGPLRGTTEGITPDHFTAVQLYTGTAFLSNKDNFFPMCLYQLAFFLQNSTIFYFVV